MFVNSDVN